MTTDDFDRERLDALKERIDSVEVRLVEFGRVSTERGPVLQNLKEEVNGLRIKFHELSTEVSPLTMMRSSLSEMPARIQRIETQVLQLADLPGKFDEFRQDFFVFKGKILGGLVISAILAPVFTGLVTGLVLWGVTQLFRK